jgi:hypothetical protein
MQALPKETFKNWNMKYSENKTKFNSSKKSNSNFVFPSERENGSYPCFPAECFNCHFFPDQNR